MQTFWDWVWHAVFGLASTAFIVWVLWRWLKASDEPLALIMRWIISAVVLGFVLTFAARAKDEMTKIAAVLVGAVGGLIMAIVWREKFCEFVADQFTSLYTGGSQEVDPTPFYSIAEARRKRGQFDLAIDEIHKQLQRFPNDFRGWMLLAEIQAEDQGDLSAARATLEEILSQPGHAPKNIAFALNREADWHLKLNQDPVAARIALERITEILPETEQAQLALQRIAHLATPEHLVERREPRRLVIRQGPEDLGLRSTPPDIRPAEEDPGFTASNYVRHLQEHPYDNEAREKLALIYARHYRRLDLATDQLEQLIAFPNQPARSVVHWLNTLADVQIELTGDSALAEQTLRRVVDLYPKSASAENALSRIAHLKLELRPKKQSQVIKLGSYEENIGLKGPRGDGSIRPPS